MTRKRFVLIVVVVTLITAALELRGAPLNGQSSTFRVIGPGIVVSGESVYAINTSSPPFGWAQLPQGNFDLPPVPPSSLVSYTSGITAITDLGEGWAKINGAWTDIGPVPGLVPVKTESWGQLKVKYAR